MAALMSQDLKTTGDAPDGPGKISDADLDLAVRGIKGTPEEIERQWFEKIYTGRGDSQKQLTWRAVVMGGILGMFMAISNLYTTLKLGWSFGVAITACVLSFVIWNSLRALSGGKLSQMTILENNCMQSTASAAGSSTGAALGTAFGALLLIEGVHRPWYVVAPFALFTAALGVFLAIPMKRQMINHEQLKFPSGIAAAETLRSLYSEGAEALKKAYALLIALAAGGLVGLLRSYGTLVDQLRATGRPVHSRGPQFSALAQSAAARADGGTRVRAERVAGRRGHDNGAARFAVDAAGGRGALFCGGAAVAGHRSGSRRRGGLCAVVHPHGCRGF
jgi:hypothetical protein